MLQDGAQKLIMACCVDISGQLQDRQTKVVADMRTKWTRAERTRGEALGEEENSVGPVM
jgi:hypothetical protein